MNKDLATANLMLDMIREMSSVKDVNIYLMYFDWSKNWSCQFELITKQNNQELKIHITNRHADPAIAVAMTYEKWRTMNHGKTVELTPTFLSYNHQEEPKPVF